jgi:ribosomal protein S27E/chorismate mutase
MPFHALTPSKNIIFADEADDGEDVHCVECGSELHTVRSHTRGDEFVSKHFRHPGSGGSGSGSSCGGGESDRHQVMKAVALSKLRHKFDLAASRREQDIGEKRADAYGRLEQPTIPYGYGFGIEVQYRNESKDIEATTQEYLDHGYTAVWLWDEQFEGKDVDLFGGTVVTPWPHAVPEVSDWSGHSREISARRRWAQSWSRGEFESGAPATLPPDFADEIVQRAWSESDWDERFTPPPYPRYLMQALSAPSARTKLSTPKLPPEWADETAEELWEALDWDDRFSPPEEEYSPPQVSHALEVPIHQFISRSRWKAWWQRGKQTAVREADVEKPPHPFDDVQCWNCGTYWHHSKEHVECPDCGTSVDWSWNIQTDRISPRSVPEIADWV